MLSEVQCPVCKGKGSLPKPAHREVDGATVARLLREQGYSIRQIMRFLGYKSPRSVALLLDRGLKGNNDVVRDADSHEVRVRVFPRAPFQPPETCPDCAKGVPFRADGHHVQPSTTKAEGG